MSRRRGRPRRLSEHFRNMPDKAADARNTARQRNDSDVQAGKDTVRVFLWHHGAVHASTFQGVYAPAAFPGAGDAHAGARRSHGTPAPYLPRQQAFLRTFAQSQEWSRILGVRNIPDVNHMIEEKRMREFIRVNEALQVKSIAGIADQIVGKRRADCADLRAVVQAARPRLPTGWPCSCKVLGRHPHVLSLDDFYLAARHRRPRTSLRQPRPGAYPGAGYSAAAAIRIEQLLSGKTVQMPEV